MHYYLAKSRAEGEKEKLNGVLAHQAAFPFLLLCGDSRKGRKTKGFSSLKPGDRSQNVKSRAPQSVTRVLAHQAAFPFLLLCGDSRKGRKIFKNKINNFSKLP